MGRFAYASRWEETIMAVCLQGLLWPVAIHTMLAREWWQSGITYKPLSPSMYVDPYPTYAVLRTKDPVHWSPLANAWVLSRYEDVDAILKMALLPSYAIAF
jgi:cytochrome P450